MSQVQGEGWLARLGAPAAVQYLAQTLQAVEPGHTEQGARLWLMLAKWAALQPGEAFALLPEVQRLLALDGLLPRGLGVMGLDSSQAPRAAPTLRVRRTFEAETPPIHARASFVDAARCADDRACWDSGAPQMSIDLPLQDLLPADGRLWRGRLGKRTDLLFPLAAGLVTRETIEISADGRDRPGGGGWRRYEHFLHSCDTRPAVGRDGAAETPLTLLEDSGSIELQGTAGVPGHVVLRIRKRVTVLLPQELDARFGAVLPLALSTLLWSWAAGFLRRVAPPAAQSKLPPSTQVGKVQLPDKQVRPDSQGKVGSEVRVAVVGGGPAGLACAWLLSNPGGKAWRGPQNLSLKVTLFEKRLSLGGKAASHSFAPPDDTRIEEHGLHVLMGCYSNLLRMLHVAGASGGLQPRRVTRVATEPAKGGVGGVDLELQPWPHNDDRVPFAQWFTAPRMEKIKLGALGEWVFRLWEMSAEDVLGRDPAMRAMFQLGRATLQPRPLLRLVVGLWEHAARTWPVRTDAAGGEPVDLAWLQRAALGSSFMRLAMLELAATARSEFALELRSSGAPPDLLVPLTRQLRGLARVALPMDSPNAEVALAGDVIELATSVVIGLAEAGVFPNWVIGRKGEPLDDGYTQWARNVQALDAVSLADWLAGGAVKVATGYVGRSRVLAAVTAGLFTRPEEIGAGTFVHGLVRLLLTYEDAPYLMLKGGTGHAVINPIVASMGSGVDIQTGQELKSLQLEQGRLVAVTTQTGDTPGANGGAPKVQTTRVEAVVLAMPPFEGAFEGLGLDTNWTNRLRDIGNTATLSIQNWSGQAPRYPGVVESGLDSQPMRCAAAMDHLAGEETKDGVTLQPPVYYCGEVSDEVAMAWAADKEGLGEEWLRTHAGSHQPGTSEVKPYIRVNSQGSERYVSASPESQQARPYVFDTGVPNLWVAGDWTRSAFSCGSIEGAVTSGLEAARHLLWELGCSVDFPITGSMFDKEPQ